MKKNQKIFCIFMLIMFFVWWIKDIIFEALSLTGGTIETVVNIVYIFIILSAFVLDVISLRRDPDTRTIIKNRKRMILAIVVGAVAIYTILVAVFLL